MTDAYPNDTRSTLPTYIQAKRLRVGVGLGLPFAGLFADSLASSRVFESESAATSPSRSPGRASIPTDALTASRASAGDRLHAPLHRLPSGHKSHNPWIRLSALDCLYNITRTQYRS
jgi:hypothetical protein